MKIIITLFIIIMYSFFNLGYAFNFPKNECRIVKTSLTSDESLIWHQITCPNLYGQKQSINILDIDLANASIQVRPIKAEGNQLETIPTMANRDDAIVAGVNGGYFYNSGGNPGYKDPSCPSKPYPQSGDLGDSLLQINGQVLSVNCDHNEKDKTHFARSVFALDEKGNPYIQQVSPGMPLMNLQNGTNEVIANAVGGGPNLVSTAADGKGFINITEEGLNHLNQKAPRTAVGITRNKHLLFVTVDGKGPTVGMQMRELADFMLNYLDVAAAMNLDGGGSTTMCIKTTLQANENNCVVVNQPSDAIGPRKVHDGLFILKIKKSPY